MGSESRVPGPATVLGVLLLVGSLGATWWWFNHPAPATAPAPPADGDVFCSGRVDVTGQVIALEPVQSGRVAKIKVAEGDTVSKGQEILLLDSAIPAARLAQAEATVEAAQVELDSAIRDKERVPGQLAGREALVNAAAARVAAGKAAIRQRQEQGKVTPLGQAELDTLQAQVRDLEQIEIAQRRELDDLKKIDPELRVRAARARLKAAEADQVLAAKSVADCTLTAPAAGTVLRLQTSEGALLFTGSPVPAVVFAPAGPLVVRAEVDQEFLARVKPGLPAEVQDENRPDGPVWKGRVRDVARWVGPRRSFVLEPGEVNDVRTVECLIELDPGAADKLWIGQRMRVRVLRPGGAGGPSSGAAR
ncbi:MAG: biotin/lipoyl-binding protein [Gemmataceae bacterium]